MRSKDADGSITRHSLVPRLRVQKYLRNLGLGSIRFCDGLVQGGKVIVNDVVLSDPTYYLQENDRVAVGNQSWIYKKRKTEIKQYYFLFHKPRGMLCSRKDIRGRSLIFESFRDFESETGRLLFYAGRLDYNSRGLMILSSDGQFIHQMSHPSKNHFKEYIVTTGKPIDFGRLKYFSLGTTLQGVRYHPFTYQRRNIFSTTLILQEGKNRQIRRLFKTMNNQVKDLLRVRIGPYCLKKMEPGEIHPFTLENER